ncbi:Gfo/Idh/MocA family protein [Ruthenibacterium lactatiformans]|uniref:Gfo/Idh/MocA family protein n=1 Tax=Ruthenibacterium lactatiformans TaxID=1550024 RepID=UPI0035218904
MVLDWGVHLLDQALMMVPEKVVRVYASFTNITNERVEDGFTVELTFENGLVFVAEVGTNNFIALPRWYVLCRDGTALIQNWNEQGKMVYVTDRQHNDAVPVRTAAGLTKDDGPAYKRYLFGTAAAAGTGRYSRFFSQCDGGDRAQSRAGCQTGAGETRHAPDGSGIPLCADASICSV